jgi:hypothetical protein
MRFLILLRRKGRVWEQPGLDTINLPCQVQSYLFQMLCFCSISCTGCVQNLLNMTSGGVFVQCMVEVGKLIWDRILSVTPLEDLQIKAPLLSEDGPIITYPDTSNVSTLPAWEELLQLTTLEIGSEDKIKDPTPFALSIEEDCFDGDSSKAPTCDIKDLKFEPAGQNLEELLASMENLLELSALISRNWSIAVEEDGSYIRIYPDAKAVYCCLQGFHSRRFAMIQGWD